MANPFVHLELNTPDLAKAKEFYGQLCGWTFEDSPTPHGVYSLFRPDNGPGGGIMSMPDGPTQWLPYIGVDDIHAATDKAEALGAKVCMRAQEVPQMGWFSVLTDPTGAAIALWQGR
ncbi:VOC family protein [Paracidobacterium acidisoli]|uniref:VOC family protein n=1 Tax=Paracidobacterium acidisoli TaxID=2303751 RepID=A0A372IMG1_9BACT|nr:VOC family protein [Paracidobacterium acidisoli]MBT9331775.1 VOC family protein [Paracidobacterium acidisoli]